jgi:hypothetical protein
MNERALSMVRKVAGLGPVNVTARQKYLALGVAGLADIVQAVFWPTTIEGAASPVELGIDAVTALIIVLILGWNWRLAAAFAFELIPGVALFPTWSAVVLTFAATTATSSAPGAARAPGLPGAAGRAALPSPGASPLADGADAGAPRFAGAYAKRTRSKLSRRDAHAGVPAGRHVAYTRRADGPRTAPRPGPVSADDPAPGGARGVPASPAETSARAGGGPQREREHERERPGGRGAAPSTEA